MDFFVNLAYNRPVAYPKIEGREPNEGA